MKKSNNGFYGVITFIIVAASFVFCWKSLLPQYQKNQAMLTQLRTDIDEANAKRDSLDKAKSSLDQLGNLPNQLFVAVPGDKDTPNLITEIEALAAKYKIVVPSIAINDSTSKGSTASANSSAVNISFAVTGNFDDLANLIGSLEKDIRFMNIKSVNLSSSDKQGMSLSINIEAYKRPGDSTATATATNSTGNALPPSPISAASPSS